MSLFTTRSRTEEEAGLTVSKIRKRIEDGLSKVVLWKQWFDKDPVFREFVLCVASDILRDELIVRSQHILTSASVARRQGAIRKRVPSFLCNANAVANALNEFEVYVHQTLLPTCNDIKLLSCANKAKAKTVLSSYEETMITRNLKWSLRDSILELLKDGLSQDLYVLAHAWRACADEKPQEYAQINSWYQTAMDSLYRSNWQVISQDETTSLLCHPLLPHPAHFVHIRKSDPHARTTTPSWAQVAAEISCSGDASLLVHCGFRFPRMKMRPEATVVHSLVQQRSESPHEWTHFREYEQVLAENERLIACADERVKGRSSSSSLHSSKKRRHCEGIRATKRRHAVMRTDTEMLEQEWESQSFSSESGGYEHQVDEDWDDDYQYWSDNGDD